MRTTEEISLELMAQELLSPPSPTGLVEVDDICALAAVNPTVKPADNTAIAQEEFGEIELTAEEIDALLEGSEIRRR